MSISHKKILKHYTIQELRSLNADLKGKKWNEETALILLRFFEYHGISVESAIKSVFKADYDEALTLLNDILRSQVTNGNLDLRIINLIMKYGSKNRTVLGNLSANLNQK